MRLSSNWRLWLEFSGAIAGAVSFGATLIWPTWIELAFGVDPDGGNGELEWLVVVASLIVMIGASLLARRKVRRGLLMGPGLS